MNRRAVLLGVGAAVLAAVPLVPQLRLHGPAFFTGPAAWRTFVGMKVASLTVAWDNDCMYAAEVDMHNDAGEYFSFTTSNRDTVKALLVGRDGGKTFTFDVHGDGCNQSQIWR